MSRHPYTYSCDYIRHFGPVGRGGVVLSRADASAIRGGIAMALGMLDEELAERLSNYYQLHEERLTREAIPRLTAALFPAADED